MGPFAYAGVVERLRTVAVTRICLPAIASLDGPADRNLDLKRGVAGSIRPRRRR
jgi:hypothetical protein